MCSEQTVRQIILFSRLHCSDVTNNDVLILAGKLCRLLLSDLLSALPLLKVSLDIQIN